MKIKLTSKSLKVLKKTTWDWFSKYIRLKYADSDGMVACVTCGQRHHWKEMDAGHFVQRNFPIHFLNEKNVHPQDTKCNRFAHGEQFKHGQYIDKVYGEGTAKLLMDTKNQECHRAKTDYLCLIEIYKQKAKEQAERIGIKL